MHAGTSYRFGDIPLTAPPVARPAGAPPIQRMIEPANGVVQQMDRGGGSGAGGGGQAATAPEQVHLPGVPDAAPNEPLELATPVPLPVPSVVQGGGPPNLADRVLSARPDGSAGAPAALPAAGASSQPPVAAPDTPAASAPAAHAAATSPADNTPVPLPLPVSAAQHPPGEASAAPLPAASASMPAAANIPSLTISARPSVTDDPLAAARRSVPVAAVAGNAHPVPAPLPFLGLSDPLRAPRPVARRRAYSRGELKEPRPPSPPEEDGFFDHPFMKTVDADSAGPNTGFAGTTAAIDGFNTAAGVPPTTVHQDVGYGTTTGGLLANVAGGVKAAIDLNEVKKGSVSSWFKSLFKGPSELVEQHKGQDPAGRNHQRTAGAATKSLANNVLDAAGTATKAAGAATAGTAVGAVASIPVFFQSLHRFFKSIWRHKKLPSVPAGVTERQKADQQKKEEQLNYVKGQLKKRALRSGLGAIGAGLQIAGGFILVASMASPVGWALAGAGALVAASLGIYKLGRWLHKRYNKQNGTERKARAQQLWSAAMKPGGPDDHTADILNALGIPKPYTRTLAGVDGVKLLMDKLQSH